MKEFLGIPAIALLTAYVQRASAETTPKRQLPTMSYFYAVAPPENISPEASEIAASLEGDVTPSDWLFLTVVPYNSTTILFTRASMTQTLAIILSLSNRHKGNVIQQYLIHLIHSIGW